MIIWESSDNSNILYSDINVFFLVLICCLFTFNDFDQCFRLLDDDHVVLPDTVMSIHGLDDRFGYLRP